MSAPPIMQGPDARALERVAQARRRVESEASGDPLDVVADVRRRLISDATIRDLARSVPFSIIEVCMILRAVGWDVDAARSVLVASVETGASTRAILDAIRGANDGQAWRSKEENAREAGAPRATQATDGGEETPTRRASAEAVQGGDEGRLRQPYRPLGRLKHPVCETLGCKRRVDAPDDRYCRWCLRRTSLTRTGTPRKRRNVRRNT